MQVLHGDSELAIVATLVEVSRSRRRRSNILSDNINKTQSLVYEGKNLLEKSDKTAFNHILRPGGRNI